MTRQDPDLERLFNVLRGDHKDPVTGEHATDPDLLGLERRLKRAVERDRSGSAQPDGYPTSSLGEGQGTSDTTPTERAVLGHYQVDPMDPEGPGFWNPRPDPVRDIVRKARRAAETAAQELTRCRKELDRLDVLTGITGAASLDPEPCEWCARFGEYEEMVRFTDVGGRLSRKWRLGSFCYDVTRRTDALPNAERVSAYHAGRKQRQKAS